MSLFLSLTEDEFIKQYWQQKPLLTQKAFTDLQSLITGDELAGLACEEEVESRIISGYQIDGVWYCRQGPFVEDDFSALTEKNWTLLVQGLEQWDEKIGAILNYFSFLPRWRLEDIMASYAPIGGGVGPHFDYYDVFLIQVSGEREWHIGQQCDESTVLQKNTDLKLLTEFHIHETYKTKSGDMLYVPAGVAHWGTALTDDCITFSVGFRAPSEKDIVEKMLENLAQELSENNRYRDTLDSIDKSSNKINLSVKDNITNLLEKITPDYFQQAAYHAFGQLVTEVNETFVEYQEEQSWTVEKIRLYLKDKGAIKIKHNVNSRFAYMEGELFVNGEAYKADEKFSQMLCDKEIIMPLSKYHFSILVQLLNHDLISMKC